MKKIRNVSRWAQHTQTSKNKGKSETMQLSWKPTVFTTNAGHFTPCKLRFLAISPTM